MNAGRNFENSTEISCFRLLMSLLTSKMTRFYRLRLFLTIPWNWVFHSLINLVASLINPGCNSPSLVLIYGQIARSQNCGWRKTRWKCAFPSFPNLNIINISISQHGSRDWWPVSPCELRSYEHVGNFRENKGCTSLITKPPLHSLWGKIDRKGNILLSQEI